MKTDEVVPCRSYIAHCAVVLNSKKVGLLTICGQAWPLPSWMDHAHLVLLVSARKNLIGCGTAGPQLRGNRPTVVRFHGMFDLRLASSWTRLWNLHRKNSNFFTWLTIIPSTGENQKIVISEFWFYSKTADIWVSGSVIHIIKKPWPNNNNNNNNNKGS